MKLSRIFFAGAIILFLIGLYNAIPIYLSGSANDIAAGQMWWVAISWFLTLPFVWASVGAADIESKEKE